MLKTIEKERIKELPSLQFQGKVEICDTTEKVISAIPHLLESEVLGFDTESRPSFKKGVKYPVSLLQIASQSRVYIIQLQRSDFPGELVKLFENDSVTKVGIGIRDDIRELKSLVSFNPQNLVDLNEWAPELGFEKIGARNLSAMILGGRISKQQQTSNWANETLTQAQIDYAATDAWICVEIYLKLKSNGF